MQLQVFPFRRLGPRVRPPQSRRQRERGTLLPKREPPQADLHAEPSLPGPGARSGEQGQKVQAEQRHQARAETRRRPQLLRQSDHRLGTGFGERTGVCGGLQVREDVRIASRSGWSETSDER